MATLDIAIAAGTDDAHEADDGTAFASTNTAVRCESSTGNNLRFNAGLRFTGITIAAGSTVNVAYVTIEAVNTSVDDPNVQIHCEAADNAVAFDTNADVTSRARTTAFTQWTATAIGTGRVNSPSIVSAIQEVIDRGGWASGNALVVFLDGKADVTSAFRVDGFEKSAGEAAALHIEYTAPAAGGWGQLLSGKRNRLVMT